MAIEALGIYLGCASEERERSVAELPVLGDLEQQAPAERGWEERRGGRAGVAKLKRRRHAPLSAYSTYSQRPLSTSARFSEFDLEELIAQRTLAYIRTLGHGSIRPIGIGKTVRELEREKQGRQENQPAAAGPEDCQPRPVENRDELAGALEHMAFDLDRGLQSEQEESYNYDDEFDRVEEEATVEPRPTERVPAGTRLYGDSQLPEAAYLAAYAHELEPPEAAELTSLSVPGSAGLGGPVQGSRVSSLNAGRAEGARERYLE
ncbi:ACL101Cp [Eremothecium gossypii ATCC 10895]|uniref:ACL101Cp n=1 Tax=Eremothecium gossypii (strain ATCC 10895 / CBS 109.51 / FGSC 9923 / NRRL Y-1056) TaxID=284811 RepID=Q75CM0_EREGS|nr:ACL101Cp [Eremothecium gossypii ATCC 10895]AAS51127.2 ACL101Cp [Eremothecium gossypii ATCC 10895]AEY95417.1 FACL101Cp [Eremothecium gossypii FDAG1]